MKRNFKGKLIVFEGISGTGKETQAKLLQQHLEFQRISTRIIFHPSPELKLILSAWRKERQIDNITEVYLLLADRYDRVTRQIIPALDRGEWVISLRNYVSAMVYQGKTEVDRKWIKAEFNRFEPDPDFLFLFSMTPAEAMERIMKRYHDTGEALGKFETPTYLAEKSQKYLKVMKNIKHLEINAADSIDNIHQTIIKYCSQYLSR